MEHPTTQEEGRIGLVHILDVGGGTPTSKNAYAMKKHIPPPSEPLDGSTTVDRWRPKNCLEILLKAIIG